MKHQALKNHAERRPAAWFVASGIVGAIFMCIACLAIITHAVPYR